MNDTTTITHSSGKPVPQAPPFLLHLCRFFNEVCEGVVILGAMVAILVGICGSLILGVNYAVGWIVQCVFSDPFKMGAGLDGAMNTGAATLSVVFLVGIPIAAVVLILSILRDLWKKTGRAK